MIADFAQFYGLILPALGEPDDPLTYSELWAHLPRESRCVAKYNPDAAYGPVESMMRSIEHSLRVLVWRQVTKDGQKGRNMPKPLQTSGEYARNKQAADNALAHRVEIDQILGIGGEG